VSMSMLITSLTVIMPVFIPMSIESFPPFLLIVILYSSSPLSPSIILLPLHIPPRPLRSRSRVRFFPRFERRIVTVCLANNMPKESGIGLRESLGSWTCRPATAY
jgi:hypothetical protein